MIKKLENSEQSIYDPNHNFIGTMPTLSSGAILGKINELCDAVNELQKHEEQHLDLLTQLNEMRLQNTKKTEQTAPYAEQRKWIGKLCWFWSRNLKQCGILTAVLDNNKYGEDDPTEEYPFQRDSIGCWQHCEPVKPDDDIIYKGGDK